MPLRTIDSRTLHNWLEKGEAILLDVREPAEYAAVRIPGSSLLPLGSVSSATLPQREGKKLVLHCKAGRRGSTACEKLLAEDPNLEIYNLEGGLDAWKLAGNKVLSSGKFFLPLDRQVQLTIGASVLLSTLLGYFIHPGFLLVSGFFGMGLINAGLTGWCGLALFMAKMPWNQQSSICNIGKIHD